MPRRLVTTLALLSSALGVAVLTLWLRSYFVAEQIGRTTLSGANGVRWMRSVRVYSGGGGIALTLQKQRGGPELDWISWFIEKRYHRHEQPLRAGAELLEGRPMMPWNRLGFYCIAWQRRNEYDLTIDVPYWWLTALLLVLPARQIRQWRRRRVEKRGFCGRCGYDLRASRDRCPECGEPQVKISSPAGRVHD
jgi:hypothetical protein